MKSKMYLVGTFTMSVILYVSTGIQFWLTNYFTEVLQFDKNAVFIAYAIVSFTGPTTGCAFGILLIIKVVMLSIERGAMKIQRLYTMYSCLHLLELELQ